MTAPTWTSTHTRGSGEAEPTSDILSVLPDHSIRSLAIAIGDLPEGDVPGGWFVSTHPDVAKGYADWQAAKRMWNDGFATLLKEAGLPAQIQYVSATPSHLIGIKTPTGVKPNRWMRLDKNGYWIPRKRTQAEKTSKVFTLFASLEHIPQAVEFVPGMPDALWMHNRAYPVVLRKALGEHAVCAFLGTNPDDADPPFEVSEHWARMKISTFHLLRERQEAGKRK